MQNIIAAVCSFFIPGLGQLITDRVGTAILWFLICAFMYMLFFPFGIVAHIVCVIDAANF